MGYLNLSSYLALICLIYPSVCSQTDKVDKNLYQSISSGNPQNIIVQCQSDNSANRNANKIPETSAKVLNPFEKQFLFQSQLIPMPQGALAQLVNRLRSMGAKFIVLWYTNQVVVYGAWLKLVLWLVDVTTVVRIIPDTMYPPGRTVSLPVSRDSPWMPGKTPWDLTDARCSSITCFGDNVVVGIIDTGVMLNHPELQGNYYDGPKAWYDAINPTNPSQSPTDNNGNGTAALSIAVGKTVGLAPKAKWIACKACVDNGACSQAAILVCAQFMLCPWDTTKSPPTEVPSTCTFRPDIVIMRMLRNNQAQLLDPENFWFYDMQQAWNNKGIISVIPIGDTGPACNGGGNPAVYPNAFAVGATDIQGTVIDSSSRGPSFIDGAHSKNNISSGYCPQAIPNAAECTAENNQENPPCIFTKPDIVAPGKELDAASISTSKPIEPVTGTIFAAAYVGGTAALMLCDTKTNVEWNQQKAYTVLTKSAKRSVAKLLQSGSTTETFSDGSHLLCDVYIGKNCRGFPSNVCGWGLVNTCQAVIDAKQVKN